LRNPLWPGDLGEFARSNAFVFDVSNCGTMTYTDSGGVADAFPSPVVPPSRREEPAHGNSEVISLDPAGQGLAIGQPCRSGGSPVPTAGPHCATEGHAEGRLLG